MLRRILQKLQKLRNSPLHTPKKVRVIFHMKQTRHEHEVLSGSNILAIANELEIDIPHYCGGCCRCGTCCIEVIEGKENLSTAKGNEGMVLGNEKSNKGHRLACQAVIYGDIEVRIPEWF